MARNRLPMTNPYDPARFASEPRPEGQPIIDKAGNYIEPPPAKEYRARRDDDVERLRDHVGIEGGKVHPSTRGPSHQWPKVEARKPFKV